MLKREPPVRGKGQAHLLNAEIVQPTFCLNADKAYNTEGMVMETKELPARPNIEQLRNQAKSLLKACKSKDSDAEKRVLRHASKFEGKSLAEVITLQDAQLIIAREHGFFSWPKLKRRVDELSKPTQLETTHRLIQAIRKGDRTAFKRHLKAGANVKHIYDGGTDYSTFSPLIKVAIDSGYPEFVPLLARQGAHTHAWHWNALPHAHEKGLPDAVRFLESKEQSANSLCTAIRQGDYAIVKQMLSESPDLASAYEAGHTENMPPLILAAKEGHADIVLLLLQTGADPLGEYETTTFNAMTVAFYHGHTEVIEVLKSVGIESLDISNFMYAAWQGNLSLVKQYLEDGSDINEKDEHKQHVLNWAFLSGNQELIQHLFEQGADINQSLGWDGYMWFARYVENGDIDAIRQVLEAGFDVSTKAYGKTLFDWAKEYEKDEIFDLLTTYRANQTNG